MAFTDRTARIKIQTMTQADKHHPDSASDPSWFERNVNLIIGGLIVAGVALLVVEAVMSQVHPFFDEHHPAHFKIEDIFGYQAVIGFVAFVTAVFLGKFLRLFVRREENYYDR